MFLTAENAEDAERANMEKIRKMDKLTEKVIGIAIAMHRTLGPGLLESAYEQCLAYDLSKAGIQFKRQVELPVRYREVNIDCGYRVDFLIEDMLIVELKAVGAITPVHQAQILTYLRLSGCKVGLLINFNVKVLKDGIRRLVLDYKD